MPLLGINPEPFGQQAQRFTTMPTFKHWKSDAIKHLLSTGMILNRIFIEETPQAHVSSHTSIRATEAVFSIYSPNI